MKFAQKAKDASMMIAILLGMIVGRIVFGSAEEYLDGE